jgi:thiosulfate/3-mercaptopyruvate sulfurtransferase
MFRVFGYDKVAMLDGGFGKWTKEKLPGDMSMVRPEQRSFQAIYRPELVRGLRDMTENLVSGAAQVIDARGPGKFDGTQEDVFPFRKLGHIPNATNIPWADLVQPDSGEFIAPEAIAARFAAAGIDLQRPIVTSCASGITSCMVALGLYLIGHTGAAVYDGSWAEWGMAEDTPAVAA